MFLIKGWTQTCVQNLIKIPAAQSPKTISTAWPLAWPRTDGWCLGRSSPRRSDLSDSVCPKEKSTSPSLDKTQPQSPSPAFNIRSLRGVDKNSPGCTCWQFFFQHQFGLIFFPPHIRTCDGPGIWGNGWAGSCRENFNRCINCSAGPAYLDHFPPG